MNAPKVPPKQVVPIPRLSSGRPNRYKLLKPHIFCMKGKWYCGTRDANCSYAGHTAPVYAYRAWKRALKWVQQGRPRG